MVVLTLGYALSFFTEWENLPRKQLVLHFISFELKVRKFQNENMYCPKYERKNGIPKKLKKFCPASPIFSFMFWAMRRLHTYFHSEMSLLLTSVPTKGSVKPNFSRSIEPCGQPQGIASRESYYFFHWCIVPHFIFNCILPK